MGFPKRKCDGASKQKRGSDYATIIHLLLFPAFQEDAATCTPRYASSTVRSGDTTYPSPMINAEHKVNEVWIGQPAEEGSLL